MRRGRSTLLAAALGVAVVLGVGCARKTVAPLAVDEPPVASSPTGALQRFAWGLNHKDRDVVIGLLTDDFLFLSAGTDSAGNGSIVPAVRPWFLAALEDSSFSVSVVLGPLVVFPDSRPGKNPNWHKQVRTSVHEQGRMSNLPFVRDGNLLFFLTRGDSAAIPLELRNRGLKPDSTRWWLDRMEDETLVAP